MKQPFVKMMNRIAEMENCILKGLVLDEHGNWVTIDDRKAVEEDSLAHLSAGQVLFEGRWVTFTEVKTSRTQRIEKPPMFGRLSAIISPKAPEPAIAAEPPAAPAVQPPTVVGTAPGITIIVQSQPPQPPPAIAPSSAGAPPARAVQSSPIQTPETAGAPPETAIIIQTPPPSSEKREVTAPPVRTPDMPFPPETAIIMDVLESSHEKGSGNEEYAPETKIIVFKPPEHSTPSVAETQTGIKEGDTQFLHLPKITSPEENGPALKNRIVLIIGTMVVIATIAAVLLIVLQTAR
jgi:hypothetical protein